LQTREDDEDEEEEKRKLSEIIIERVSEKGKEMEWGIATRQEKKKRKRREERKVEKKESMRRFGS
jgi:hypothetical protein